MAVTKNVLTLLATPDTFESFLHRIYLFLGASSCI